MAFKSAPFGNTPGLNDLASSTHCTDCSALSADKLLLGKESFKTRVHQQLSGRSLVARSRLCRDHHDLIWSLFRWRGFVHCLQCLIPFPNVRQRRSPIQADGLTTVCVCQGAPNGGGFNDPFDASVIVGRGTFLDPAMDLYCGGFFGNGFALQSILAIIW